MDLLASFSDLGEECVRAGDGGMCCHMEEICAARGRSRFMGMVRDIGSITPRFLSKEWRDLEQSQLVTRTVLTISPATLEYELTGYGHRVPDGQWDVDDGRSEVSGPDHCPAGGLGSTTLFFRALLMR